MALNRTTNASGQIEVKEGLLMTLEFEYRNGEAPQYARWRFNEGEVSVNGNYSVTENKVTDYSVSNGFADPNTLQAAAKVLARIKKEYQTM